MLRFTLIPENQLIRQVFPYQVDIRLSCVSGRFNEPPSTIGCTESAALILSENLSVNLP
jgi:hypothetical protein